MIDASDNDILARSFCVEFTEFPGVDEAWLEARTKEIGEAIYDRMRDKHEWGVVCALSDRAGIGLAFLLAPGFERDQSISQSFFDIVSEKTGIEPSNGKRKQAHREGGLPKVGLGPRFPPEFYRSKGRAGDTPCSRWTVPMRPESGCITGRKEKELTGPPDGSSASARSADSPCGQRKRGARMAAKQVRYYDYRQIETVECRCGWSGDPGPCEDYFHALLDVTCPRCDTMLLIVPYPTDDETREAAAAGNEEAIAELKRLQESERKGPDD